MPSRRTDVVVEGTEVSEAAPIHENLSVYRVVYLQ